MAPNTLPALAKHLLATVAFAQPPTPSSLHLFSAFPHSPLPAHDSKPAPFPFQTQRRRRPARSCDAAAAAADLIPGTPCFTRHITTSPMRPADRGAYLAAVVDAAVAYCADFSAARVAGRALPPALCNLTLLLPQLDPELDVFDRRFVLALTWALVNGLCFEAGLRTRVLVQGVGKYGAVPLSVAGLRRTFEADMAMSAEEWGGEEAMAAVLRTADLEDPGGVDDGDEAVVVVTPCNATNTPVVQDVMDLVERVGPGRPMFLVNPRLNDVPSAAGMMGVGGRAGRNAFRESWTYPFYMRLLFDSGTMYPLRGIMYRAYPGPWQLWRPAGSPELETETYRLVGEYMEMPNGDQIGDAMAAERRRRRLEEDGAAAAVGIDTLLASNLPVVLGIIAVAMLAALAKMKGDIQLGP